jgi:hypothetical protein
MIITQSFCSFLRDERNIYSNLPFRPQRGVDTQPEGRIELLHLLNLLRDHARVDGIAFASIEEDEWIRGAA